MRFLLILFVRTVADRYSSPVIPVQNATVGGVQHDPIPYFFPTPLLPGATLPIFATSNSTTVPDDACDPLPDNTPDLSDKLVLIRRGTCPFTQKLTNVAAKGAKVMLIYEFVPISQKFQSEGNH